MRNEHGDFILTRSDQSIEFVCDRCLQPKFAKIQVSWTPFDSQRTKIICNGCYGRLSSGRPLR